MRRNHRKCGLDFRKPASSESPHEDRQFLDCNSNGEMVIGSDAEILARLRVGRLLGGESIGKFRFRFYRVAKGPFFQPENAKHIQQRDPKPVTDRVL